MTASSKFLGMSRRLLPAAVFLMALAVPAQAVPVFVKETGVMTSSAVAQAITGDYSDPGGARVFYIRESTKVFSARTSDGLTWTEEADVRISSTIVPRVEVSSITGLSILPLDAGGFRMLYAAEGSTGTKWRIYTATSTNGWGWASSSTAVEVAGGATFVGYPSMVELGTGDWRVYYIQDSNGGNDLADRQVYTALSTDEGFSWGTPAVVLSTQARQVAATTLTDNKVRLFYTLPLAGKTSSHNILSAISATSAGTSFTQADGIRLSTPPATGSIISPLVVRTTDPWTWRMYYNFALPAYSTGPVFSAVVHAPDPTGFAVGKVYQTEAAKSFTITGEAFSTTPTAALSRGGNSDIAGTGLTRTDDQNLLYTFDTLNAELGWWDLTVTNDNGQGSTLTNALLVDYIGGSVSLTDNLMRPNQGGRTRIDVEIFHAGRTLLKLYTIDGRLVTTLFDRDLPSGITTMFWDGKTGSGNTVASGVYFLHVLGPKLNSKSKIVVIN